MMAVLEIDGPHDGFVHTKDLANQAAGLPAQAC